MADEKENQDANDSQQTPEERERARLLLDHVRKHGWDGKAERKPSTTEAPE